MTTETILSLTTLLPMKNIIRKLRKRDEVRVPRLVPKKAIWSHADDATLVRVLTAQAAAGNQADNNWKGMVWQACTTELAGSESQTWSGGVVPATAANGVWDMSDGL